MLNDSCSICYNILNKPILEPNCQYLFCGQCFFKWLEINNSCPMCRHNINIQELIYIDTDNINNNNKNEIIMTKTEKIVDLIKKNVDGRFLIFSQHDDSFYPISKALIDNKILFSEIKGNIKRKEKNIFDYKIGKVSVIFLNSNVNCAGLNLEETTDIILYHEMSNHTENQIIGRAVRNYSHHSLEPSERTVEIYKYVSVHYDQNINVDRNKLTNFFIDREKYILSEEKDRSNKIVERRLKELSFDCTLNSTRNKINDPNLAGSAECDYTNCDYQCLIKPKNDIIDKSTYNMYITFFDQFDIYFVLETIRNLFQNYFVWSLDDIIHKIKEQEPLITDEAIYTTLNHIVQDKVHMSDMYNRDGFIINRGPYYIFNNSELDIDGSLYSKILDFSVDKTKYTLQQFTKTNLKTNIFEETKKKSKEIEELDEESILKNQLTKQALEYNKHIEDTYDIYGTYRMKKLDSDKWEHKYGKLDTQFRLNIKSDKTAKDKRKETTGKWIGSYKKDELISIANTLNIPIIENYQKDQLGEVIEVFLKQHNRILK